MQSPTIAAVIPTANRPHLVVRALASVKNQSHKADQILVVDDGSQQSSLSLVGDGVTVIRTDGRAGASAARNLGAESARTDFVAFLDDDDYWEPDYLEWIHRALCRDPRIDLVITKLRRKQTDVILECPTPDISNLRHELMVGNPGLVGSNIVVMRELFWAAGGFNESLPASGDRAFGIEALRAGASVAFEPRAKTVLDDSQPTGRLSFGLGATYRKVPFVVRYWPEMTKEERRANLRRLNKVRRQEMAFLLAQIASRMPPWMKTLLRSLNRHRH